MWIARDKDGILTLFTEYPIRVMERWNGKGIMIDTNICKALTWKDEPLEVCLRPTTNSIRPIVKEIKNPNIL